MLPVSTKDVIPFTPRADQIATLQAMRDDAGDDATRARLDRLAADLRAKAGAAAQAVFRLAVPSHFQRAAFRRDLRAAGAHYPGDADLYRALRDDLRAVNPANLDALLEVVDEAEAAAVGEVDPDAIDRLGDIARLARAAGGRFAGMEGEREYWLSMAPIVACRHFLLGWEGVTDADGAPAPFERRGALTSDATLQRLDEPDLRAVGFKIMSLMRPSKDQEKNSASPSRSPTGPTPTPTATTLLTAPSGTSSASATPETPEAG